METAMKVRRRILVNNESIRSVDNEWMWVEILSWKDDDIIKGLLKNQPFQIPNLKAGSKVSIKTSDVFDYIHRLPDGSSEGNKTGEIIQKNSR